MEIINCSWCGAPNSSKRNRCVACANILNFYNDVNKWSPTHTSSQIDLIPNIIDLVRASTVVVQAPCIGGISSLGTGFFVNSGDETYLITNLHVVSESINGLVTVRFSKKVNPREDAYNTNVVYIDPINDLAILDIPFKIPETAKTLELADLSDLRDGHQVVAVGNPNGQEFNCIAGIVANSNYKMHDMQMSCIICELPSAPGNSGGPVVRVNDKKVIGVASSIPTLKVEGDKAYGQTAHTFCVSADAIRQIIYSYNKSRR